MRQHVKLFLTAVTSFCLSTFILLAFWFQDWQYALPTPRPARLVQAAPGAVLSLGSLTPRGKPLLLHFYNPACPCSRFNLDHVRQLVRRYGARVEFVAVLEGAPTGDVRAEVQRDHLSMKAIADPDGAIARRCGVYSTPQAVLLEPGGTLFYRGNYNAGRYCTVRSTEFARLALEAVLASAPSRPLPRAAAVAYGCQLPSNPALPVAAGRGFPRLCAQKFLRLGGHPR